MNATIPEQSAIRIHDAYQRSSRLTLALCIAALAIMIAAAALIGASLIHLAETRDAVAQALAVNSELKDLNSQMLDAETGERGFLLSGRSIYLQPYYEALTQMGKSRTALEEALHHAPAAKGQIDALNKAVAIRLAQFDRAVLLQSTGHADDAVSMELNDTGKASMDSIRNAMRDLISGQDRLIVDLQSEYVTVIRNNYWTVAASLALNALLFFGLVHRMRNATSQWNVARMEMGKHNEELSLFLQSAAERNAQINGLSELSRFLQSCADMGEAIRLLKQQLPPLLRAKSGALYLLVETGDQLHQEFAWGPDAYAECIELGDCWAVRLGQPFRQPDQKGASGCKHLQTDAMGIRNDIHCLPLLAHGELMGLLVLDAGVASDADANVENEGYRRITLEQVGLSIGNLKLRESLHQQSIRDALTDLYNRRFLEESAQRELLRAIRLRTEGSRNGITFLMIDIDHFKHFNDEFGHKVGDQVLREVSDALQRRTRGSDVVARYGGEEFTIVLVDTLPELAQRRAEQVRTDVENLNLMASGKSLGKITISIGLAQFPDHGNTVAALLLAADKALYEAKNAGRNRVVIAPEAGKEIV
jgi:diguanylate cyclase (GGDEF)-like protein